MRILIAEDDHDMRKIITLYLKKEGYDVFSVSDGEAALHFLQEHSADLLLLDWMMPVKDGIDVTKEIRSLGLPIKILMLTAKSDNSHELKGLLSGADDYLRKPFDMNILMLRIKKLCRSEQLLKCGTLTLNQETYIVERNGCLLSLTKTEFELLRIFLLNQGITLSREQLLDRIWGPEYDGDIRTVDTHIRRLRGKVGEGYIRTNVGFGYVMGDNNE